MTGGRRLWSALAAALVVASALAGCGSQPVATRHTRPPVMTLPAPSSHGSMPLEQALAQRHSVRQFTSEPLTLHQIAQLLWAAQGITRPSGGRTAPSAGALYPLEVYAVTPARVLRYLPAGNRAYVWLTGDVRGRLSDAAFTPGVVDKAPAVFVITAVVARTAAKYGGRAERYVDLEAGHAAQNVLLQATALRLGAVPMGAFDDAAIAKALELPSGEKARYLIPVGHPAP